MVTSGIWDFQLPTPAPTPPTPATTQTQQPTPYKTALLKHNNSRPTRRHYSNTTTHALVFVFLEMGLYRSRIEFLVMFEVV
jgi:hypothetical protein